MMITSHLSRDDLEPEEIGISYHHRFRWPEYEVHFHVPAKLFCSKLLVNYRGGRVVAY